MSNPKIAVYSLPDLKNTTDDALPNYLTSLKFKQSHFLTDVRLTLGYSAVAIAGITFYFDYMHGWDKTKVGTLWAVIAYFILNGALTYWIWGVEKGKIFTGEINDKLLSIASSVKKHTPIYNLTVRCVDSKGVWTTTEISSPFTRWFDADGYFVAQPFQQWLASKVSLIGEADPKNARETKAETTQMEMGESGLAEKAIETPKKSTSAAGATAGSRSRKGKS